MIMRLSFQMAKLTTDRMRKSVRGFTLVELMVTLSVLAILLGIAVPSFTGAIASTAVAGHVNTFMADARFARTEAIKRGANVTMCRSDNAETATPTCSTAAATDWSAGWLIFEKVDSTAPVNLAAFVQARGDILIRVQGALTQSGGMATASATPFNAFTYNAIGRTNNNGSITASPRGSLSIDPSYQRILVIDTVGRARWCKTLNGKDCVA
jgi:type IV fimbrial biogenesis protein FimT